MKEELFCTHVRTPRGDRINITDRADGTGILFAEVPWSQQAMEEALIFAAAPKLLEACRALCSANWNRLDDINEAISLGRAAIARAEGPSRKS